MSDQMPHDEQLRALYRELPADEPRAELDEAILAAARRRNDVERRRTLLRRLRWTVPMAAAAGLVLTLTLTRLTPEQRATTSMSPPAPQETPVGSYASRDEMREEAAPLAQPGNLQGLGDLSDGAPATPGSGAGRDNAVLDRPAARADAAPMARTARKEEAARPAAPPAAAASAAAPAPAAPPPPAVSASDAARVKSRALGQIAEMAPAPEAKELDDANRAASAAPEMAIAAKKPADEDAGAGSYGAFEAPAPAAVEPWPFGLEAGLTAEETCRRVRAALDRECEFRAGLVDLPLDPAATIDRGPHAGRSASRLTLALQDNKLWSAVLTLRLPDGTTGQVALIARDPAPAPQR